MKKITIILTILIFISCSNDDENNNSISRIDIELVTGINLRNNPASTTIELGNPNTFTDNQFIAYPNPIIGNLSISTSNEISDLWLIEANEMKIHQQTDFNSILNSDLYDESTVSSKSVIEFTDLNATNLQLDLQDLNSGYYRVFVKINDNIFWDNIYIQGNNSGIDDFDELINYWD